MVAPILSEAKPQPLVEIGPGGIVGLLVIVLIIAIVLASRPAPAGLVKYRARWHDYAAMFIGVVATVLAAASILLSLRYASLAAASLAAWAVLPPLWFFLEYFYLVDRADLAKPENKQKFDLFKHSQDVAAKCWLGIVVLLIFINRMYETKAGVPAMP
jgi:hypothetical protein